VLNPALNPDSIDAAPATEERRRFAEGIADMLRSDRGRCQGPGAPWRRGGWRMRCRSSRRQTSDAQQGAGESRHAAADLLAQLKMFAAGRAVTEKTLLQIGQCLEDQDGLQRVEAQPRRSQDNDNLRRFANAVLTASRSDRRPVSILKSGDTVVAAFIHSGSMRWR